MANSSSLVDAILDNTSPTPAPVRGKTVDEAGRARSKEDFAAAERMGFAPKQSLYERGTMVVDAGVDNARRSHLEWAAQPLVTDLCDEGIAQIIAENRRDFFVSARDLSMKVDGAIVQRADNGKTRTFTVEEKALGGLLTRAGIPGGSGYLRECWPELRAKNFNNWTQEIAKRDAVVEAAILAEGKVPEPRAMNLRTRRQTDGSCGVHAVVSTSYTPYDLDKVLEAIKLATPKGARGTLAYDGTRAKVDVLFHADTRPEDYVSGEFFRGGVSISTADDGSGSLRGHTLLSQNLCLNLIIVDEMVTGLFRVRHVGSVQALAKKFEDAFGTSLKRLEHFTRRWGFAAREDVVAQAREADAEVASLDIDDIFPGLFRGIIEQEMVAIRGDREEAVEALMDCWQKDESSARKHVPFSRAAVANAVTRYAHEVNQDPWVEELLAQQAGQIVWGNKALPFAAAE